MQFGCKGTNFFFNTQGFPHLMSIFRQKEGIVKQNNKNFRARLHISKKIRIFARFFGTNYS